MSRLISRQKFIPNGFKFYDPHLKWSPPPNASFAVICDGLRNVRLANPGITKANNLNTDANAIAEEVDRFNAAICEQHGWSDFITGPGGGVVPFLPGQPQRPSRLQRVANLAVGTVINVEWIASGAEAVPVEQAVMRAETCVKCPLNQKGDWLAQFTTAAQDAIRAQLNRKRELKLATPLDDKLGVCGACDCPMALKVWIKLEQFLPKMLPAAKTALHPDCWILSEEKL